MSDESNGDVPAGRSRTSIVRRLVAITLGAGLLTGLVGVALVRQAERREVRADAAAKNLAAAERTATLLDGRVDGVLSQLELLASRPAIATFSSDATDELGVALRVSDELDEVLLFNASGRAVAASASRLVLDPDDLPQRGGMVEGLAAGERVEIVRDGALPVVEMTVPVEDPPGRVVGALVGRTPLSLLTEEAEARLRGTATTAFVVAPDGTVLAHRELDRVLRGEVFPLTEAFGEGRRVATLRAEGQEPKLVAVALPSSLPVTVVVEQPEAEALAPVEPALGGVTVVFLAVLASILVAVILTGRRLLAPLGPMADAVERLGRGERRTRVDLRGSGEIEVLAAGFNTMAEKLQLRQEELEAAERVARRSEERLRLMVEGVADYAIVLLDLDGEVRTWNTGAKRLLGYATGAAIGRGFGTFSAPEDAEDPPVDFLEAARDAGRSDREGWCVREDGSRFWARTVVTRLHDEDGEPYGYAVVLHDLTDRQAAKDAMEEALRREQEAADELRRTAELKDEFLVIAAHELRTPLATILGASSVLAEDWDDLGDGEAADLGAMVHRHAQDMRLIVDRLLDFNRLQAGQVRLTPTHFDLWEELTSDIGLLSSHLAKHDVHINAPRTEVLLDRAALRHVVTNLVSNAAKFSDDGTTIDITATVTTAEVALEVRDRGVGIQPDEQDHIFDLFRQGSHEVSTSRGTGVGLAIVKRYVSLAGGDVTLHSTPGEGSTFVVTLPQGS